MGSDATTDPAFPWSSGLSRYTRSLAEDTQERTLDFSLAPKIMGDVGWVQGP